MKGNIYLLQDNNLAELTEQPYDSENLLQELLAKYPDLLAGDQIDDAQPRRWLLIRREMSVPSSSTEGARWALDHLLLDQDAIPTFVEVKRSSDSRIRREVVGQMLDYAANAVVYWSLEKIRAYFEANCTGNGRNPEQVLTEFLGAQADADAYWQNVKVNLQSGRVRLLFVADEIPTELRRIVEFLNQQMNPAEVLAVEIKQYVGKNLKTLVPRVIGQTVAAQQAKSAGSQPAQQWDEDSFFLELERRKGVVEDVRAARAILEWARPQAARILWGKGTSTGSFVPVFEHKKRDYLPFAVYTYGKVEFYFYWYSYKPPFDSEEKRLELLKKLNTIQGINLPESAINRRPSVPLAVLRDEHSLRQLLDIYDWYVEQVKSS